MKLPVPGFVSQALSSLINNDRRQKRIPFDEAREFEVEKTRYDFPTVSEEERKKVVKEILEKRRRRMFAGYLVLILGLLGIVALVVLAVVLP